MKLIINENEFILIGVALQRQCKFTQDAADDKTVSIFIRKIWEREVIKCRRLLKKIRKQNRDNV